MGIVFRRVETSTVRQINGTESSNLRPAEVSVVPDLTGDKIPDFVSFKCELRHERGLESEAGFNSGTYILSLTNGSYDAAGKLFRSDNPILLAQYQWSTTDLPESSSKFSLITDLQFSDLNGDGMMDISFWQFVSREKGFAQILLLATRT